MTKEFEKPSFNPSGKINKTNHRQFLVFLRFLTSPSKQREAQDSKTSSIGDSEAIVQGVCSNYDLIGIEIKALSYIGDCIKKQLKLHLMARIKPQTLLQQSKKKKGPTRISVTTIILCNLIVVLIVLSLVATYRHWSQSRSSDQGRTRLSTLEDTDAFVDSKKYGYAIINTSKGYITVELYKDGSPETVDKFLDLCQKGHFKGMPFHHVIKNYVIQGGNSKGHGAAEDWTSKVKPHSQSPKHEAFMLGTPKTKPDGKEFELFITTAPIPDLNDKLIVFGRVIKGEDVVQEIEEVDTDEHYRPKSPIGIINVTLKRDI